MARKQFVSSRKKHPEEIGQHQQEEEEKMTEEVDSDSPINLDSDSDDSDDDSDEDSEDSDESDEQEEPEKKTSQPQQAANVDVVATSFSGSRGKQIRLPGNLPIEGNTNEDDEDDDDDDEDSHSVDNVVSHPQGGVSRGKQLQIPIFGAKLESDDDSDSDGYAKVESDDDSEQESEKVKNKTPVHNDDSDKKQKQVDTQNSLIRSRKRSRPKSDSYTAVSPYIKEAMVLLARNKGDDVRKLVSNKRSGFCNELKECSSSKVLRISIHEDDAKHDIRKDASIDDVNEKKRKRRRKDEGNSARKKAEKKSKVEKKPSVEKLQKKIEVKVVSEKLEKVEKQSAYESNIKSSSAENESAKNKGHIQKNSTVPNEKMKVDSKSNGNNDKNNQCSSETSNENGICSSCNHSINSSKIGSHSFVLYSSLQQKKNRIRKKKRQKKSVIENEVVEEELITQTPAELLDAANKIMRKAIEQKHSGDGEKKTSSTKDLLKKKNIWYLRASLNFLSYSMHLLDVKDAFKEIGDNRQASVNRNMTSKTLAQTANMIERTIIPGFQQAGETKLLIMGYKLASIVYHSIYRLEHPFLYEKAKVIVTSSASNTTRTPPSTSASPGNNGSGGLTTPSSTPPLLNGASSASNGGPSSSSSNNSNSEELVKMMQSFNNVIRGNELWRRGEMFEESLDERILPDIYSPTTANVPQAIQLVTLELQAITD